MALIYIMELPEHIINKIMLYNIHPVAELLESDSFWRNYTQIHYKILKRNREWGSAFDRGRSDAYYHRDQNPHKWKFENNTKIIIPESELTEEELDEYLRGYFGEDDRKI